MRHRSDNTQGEIVEALRKAGVTVYIIGGSLDLAIGVRGRTYLADCKTPINKSGKVKYTETQRFLMDTWRGGPILTFTSAEQALALVATLP